MRAIKTPPVPPTFEGRSGSYRNLGPLGLPGATAEVYRVEREEDGLRFALKLLRPGLAPTLARRFEVEMGVLRRLAASEERLGTHHVPRIIECSASREPATLGLTEVLGRPFLLMELAAGRDLQSWLDEKGIFPEADAVGIARQLGETLLAAHETGIGYADMKSENLYWEPSARRLTVIDWNVVSDSLTVAEAHRDRLRAAAYLLRWMTGETLEVVEDDAVGYRVAGRRFSFSPAFRRLSAGTRRLLRESLCGKVPEADESVAAATRRALERLAEQSERLERSADELLERGRGAFADRQWLTAFEDLELAERRVPSAWSPERAEKVKALKRQAHWEVEQLGRRSLHSGRARLQNGLYAEALADFERAHAEDPDDDEVRLWTQAARLAIRTGLEGFNRWLPALSEAIEAFCAGHLAQAEAALARLGERVASTPELASLAAEISLHRSLECTAVLVEKDEIAEAESVLRRAYPSRQALLDEEPLAEVVAAVAELLTSVEELSRLTSEGEAQLDRGDISGATECLGRAQRLAPTNGAARQRVEWVERLAELSTLVEEGEVQEALAACESAQREAPDDAFVRRLTGRARNRLCHEIKERVEAARAAEDTVRERLAWEALLRLSADDPMARERLDALDRHESAVLEVRLDELETGLAKERSAAAAERVLAELEGSDLVADGRCKQLAMRAHDLLEKAIDLSHRYDQLSARADLDALLAVLTEAELSRIVLRQGSPDDLRRDIEESLFEVQQQEIESLLQAGNPGRAAELAATRQVAELDESRRETYFALAERARSQLKRPARPQFSSNRGPEPAASPEVAETVDAGLSLAEYQRRMAAGAVLTEAFESWCTWRELLSAVEPEKLETDDRKLYKTFEKAAWYGEVLASPIDGHLLAYLEQPQTASRVRDWIEALAWAHEQGCAPLAELRRVESALATDMRRLLDHGTVGIETISAFLLLDSLLWTTRRQPVMQSENRVSHPQRSGASAAERPRYAVVRRLSDRSRMTFNRLRSNREHRHFRRQLALRDAAAALTTLRRLSPIPGGSGSPAPAFDEVLEAQRSAWSKAMVGDGAIRGLPRWGFLNSPALWAAALALLVGIFFGWHLVGVGTGSGVGAGEEASGASAPTPELQPTLADAADGLSENHLFCSPDDSPVLEDIDAEKADLGANHE